ncbi:MAG: alcohol dehydrogenase catalytic domain-containing protein [Candidatus Brocadiia bacterium]
MKALRMVEIGRPMELQDIPAPEIDDNDEKDDNQAVVKVRACGICGTDLHHLRGTAKVSRLPITLGHEISGVVEAVGRSVSSGRLQLPVFKPGDRVAVHNVIYCGECRACLRERYNFCHNQLMFGRDVDGGLAEYVKVPARNMIPMSTNVTFPEGAILGCAVATAYHALRIARIAVGDSIVVWGTGGVGMSLLHLAREVSGAYPIIAVDRSDKLLLLARELGADVTINSTRDDPVEEIKEVTGGEGADVVFDTAGVTDTGSNETIVTLQSTCPGGQLIVVATYDRPIKIQPHDEVGVFEKRFTGSCGNLPDEIHKLMALVGGRRRLDLVKLISRLISLEEVNDVIQQWQQQGGITRAVVSL